MSERRIVYECEPFHRNFSDPHIMPTVIAYLSTMLDRPGETGALIAFAMIVAGLAFFRKLRPWQSYLRRKHLLTDNEREFFHRLTRALPKHPVFTQVALSALIAVDGRLSERHQFTIRRRFGWKYADFVICAPYSLDVLLIIELDDRTHVASGDRKRDAMMRAAGYETLRFQSKHKPTVAELADLFAKLLPTLTASS